MTCFCSTACPFCSNFAKQILSRPNGEGGGGGGGGGGWGGVMLQV